MKRTRVALIIAAGLILGLYGREAYDRLTFDRADRMFELFHAMCLADQAGDPKALGLVISEHDKNGRHWGDARSKAFVSRNGRRCSVWAADANNLTRADVKKLIPKMESAAAGFPDLAYDPGSEQNGDTLSRGWMHGGLQSDQRWGIAIYSFLPGAQDGSTMLNYYARNTDE